MMTRLIVRVHYAIDDSECCEDYVGVSVLVNKVEMVRFGNAYHDKGRQKAEGWVLGFSAARKGPCKVTTVHVNDTEI